MLLLVGFPDRILPPFALQHTLTWLALWLQAKERLRLATEKLYQNEVDAEIALEQMKEEVTLGMDVASAQLATDSSMRLETDTVARETIPAPILEVWRIINDEKDIWEGLSLGSRERLLPLEHSDLNDIESSLAQKRIYQELADLLAAILKETHDRIEEEKVQAS